MLDGLRVEPVILVGEGQFRAEGLGGAVVTRGGGRWASERQQTKEEEN